MSGTPLDFFPVIPDIWQAISSSALFIVGKWFLMLYTIVLFFDVFFLLVLRGITTDVKTQLFGAERPLTTKSGTMKRWQEILKRLKSPNPSQYKAAILEADHLADELLTGIGYKGANMGERLSSIHPGQVQTLDSLKAAHFETRNRIVNEPDFTLTREEALDLLREYRDFFTELELF